MNPQSLGEKSLRPRLSRVLTQQILHQLPSLLRDVQGEMSYRQQRLECLGSSRTTVEEQRHCLLRVTQKFSSLMKSAVDGVYNDSFYTNTKTEEGSMRRLRAVIQNRLTDFEEDMRTSGQTRIIVDSPFQEVLVHPEISRSDYIDEVKDLIRGRGRELPGTFNPLIIGDLFMEQCLPWRKITASTKEIVFEAARKSIRSILAHVAVKETVDGMMRLVSRRLDTLKSKLDQKVDELIEPHYTLPGTRRRSARNCGSR